MIWLFTAPAEADGRWLRADTEHFVVYCDGGPAMTQDNAIRLEEFAVLLQRTHPRLAGNRPRLPVIVFRTRGELARYLAGPKESVDVVGLYLPDPTRPMLALDGADPYEGAQLAFGGYYRVLVDGVRQPPFVTAGFAELYATTRIDRDYAQVGRVSDRDLDELETHRWLPLDAVATARQGSELLVRDLAEKALFDAEAWVLVHWCALDPDPARPRLAALFDLANRLTRGDPVEDAFQASFGTSSRAIQDQLEAYVQHHTWTMLHVDLAQDIDVGRVHATPAPPTEVDYQLGTLLLRQGDPDRAEPWFTSALDADPRSWMPYDGLGQLALADYDLPLARDAFRHAMDRSPTTPAPYLAYGRIPVDPVDPSSRRNAEIALQEALRLDPTLVEGFVGLAELADDPATARTLAARGLQLDGSDPTLRRLLGAAQLRLGDPIHAKINAQLALSGCRNEDQCRSARELLASIDP